MFSDNQRISRRQLGRQLLLGLSGVFLMTMPQIKSLRGWSGILGLILGTLLLWVYLFFLVRSTAVAKGLRERIGDVGYRIAALFYLTYLLLSGGYLVRLTSYMVSYVVLPDYQPWLIGILFVLAALLGTGGELQRRARLGEVACVPIVGGLFLLVILAAFQIDVGAIRGWGNLDGRQILESTYHVFCSFSIVGILPFLMQYVERPQGSVKYLFAGTGTAALLAVGGIVVISLLFGIKGIDQKSLPLAALMSSVNFPGGFLDRFDAVWMVFLIFSLLYSGGTVLYYGQHLLCKKASGWIRPLLAVAVWLLAFAAWQDFSVFQIYPWCVRHVYMPAFVVFGLVLSRVRRKS